MSDKQREESIQFVLKTAKEHDVKFIRLWFTDILGQLKSFAITAGELEGALKEGMGFDGSSIEGFTRIDESDMIAMPDPDTFQLLPWRPTEHNAVARMFCDVYRPDGKPFEGDPRFVLKKNLKKAADLGFTFYVGPEPEFFYFENDGGTTTLDKGGYFDLTPLDNATEMRRETVLTLEKMGVCVEYSHHEVAPSQHEIDMRYTDALTMADQVMTFRLVVKQVALNHGKYATFMPKPIFGENGSGMHVHQSLFKGDKNAMFDAKGKFSLSDTALHYIAGLLKYAPEITAINNQWVNSYKRLVPGYEAPCYVAWARKNRSDLIRVPEYKPGQEKATRIELRSADAATNPYLCFSVMLAAGLKGIEEKLTPPDPVEENIFKMTEDERENRGISTLPGNLAQAIALTEKSDLVKEALGDHVFHSFIENKKIEWDSYRTHISQYELDRYLPIL